MAEQAVAAADRALLARAFEAFAAASGRLESAYHALEHQLQAVRSDLAETSRERDQALRRQAETASRLAGLLDALPAGVVVLDRERRVREWNGVAVGIVGNLTAGEPWSGVIARLAGTATPPPGDLVRADGQRLRITERMTAGDSGSVLLVTDVTEQKKLDEILARHRRLAAMGEMAATLAHQVRTPLSAALLYTSNAANPALPATRREELLERAAGCLQNLEQLVSDMLGFARGAGSSDGPVDLSDLLAAVESAAGALVRPGQDLCIHAAATPLRLTGNREALAGAILNLVTNAFQSSGPAARVEIACERRGLFVEIHVRDNGPGVPEHLRERIFDPFFTSRPDGTGLGLAVVRSVAEAHGGTIQVGDNLPAGASFTLRLPFGRAATRAGATKSRGVEAA